MSHKGGLVKRERLQMSGAIYLKWLPTLYTVVWSVVVVHTCTFTCTHVHSHMYTHTHTPCMHTHAHTYTSINTHHNTHTHKHTHVHASTHTTTHTQTHHTCMHKHTHVHTQHTHKHTPHHNTHTNTLHMHTQNTHTHTQTHTQTLDCRSKRCYYWCCAYALAATKLLWFRERVDESKTHYSMQEMVELVELWVSAAHTHSHTSTHTQSSLILLLCCKPLYVCCIVCLQTERVVMGSFCLCTSDQQRRLDERGSRKVMGHY